MTRRLPLALAAAALVLTGCTSDGTDDLAQAQPVPSPTQTPAAEPRTACPEPAPETVEPPAGSTTDLTTKPEVVLPEGAAPAELQVSDIVVGDGDLVCAGDVLAMQYVGVLYDGGAQFDASWDRGEPFEFQLGAGMVIQGWDQGIVGMRQGGRRQLVIPAELGYGDRGAGADIPPGAALVFVVDVVGVQRA